MKVNIYYKGHMKINDYYGASLELPAGEYTIRYALDRAHVPEGESHNKFTLDELNLLVFKTNQMDEDQLLKFEMAHEHLYFTQIEAPNPKDTINLLYNLDHYETYPGILDDRDLGEVCLSDNLMEQINQVDDEIFELLDPRKVGAKQREVGSWTFYRFRLCDSGSGRVAGSL